MARQCSGSVAEYNPGAVTPECTWVTARTVGKIKSESYASCVGMVLYSLDHHIGVVAHFSGSLSTPQIRLDVAEILRAVCPLGPGVWKGWVFGGASLKSGQAEDSTTIQRTKEIVDIIRD